MTTTKNNMDKAIIKEIADSAIPEAVLQKCLDRPLGSVLLSRIYGVPSGWETQELKRAKNITVAASADELEAAFKTREGREIVLLKSAGYTLESLKAKLATQGNPKVIFLECS